jgi:hypothetical protein
MPRKLKTDLELAESHKYRLPDGRIAVSVTAISGFLDDGKAAAFAGAAVNLARQGMNHREEWKAKAERGTRIHNHMEKWLKGVDIEALPDEEGYLDALELFMVEQDPIVIEQEAIALSLRGYGGRFDLLCEIADKAWLLDLKTGHAYPVEHTLQLAGYRYADGLATYNPDGSLGDLKPMPEVDRAGCLYVHSDGSYDLVEYPADEEAFSAFCNLLEVYNWTRTDTIKRIIKESKGTK